MPELVEQMYCSQQIVIPPKFPYILKRYCKAAIKTQPYDLLRWSFEYFRALSERRPPPVKLRLEYPIYSTEGGLTRGCLKVLANQLTGQEKIPLTTAKAAWQGFCLDPEELQRIFCLCEVFDREDSVPYLYLIAVAAGLLTKSLTHTMILLCETLTKEPDGGSAAIPVNSFLKMYKYLARMDAGKDVRYINGYREGWTPPVEEPVEEELEDEEIKSETSGEDDYWQCSPGFELQRVSLIDDRVANVAAISSKLNQPLIGTIKRSPSVERAANEDRDKYLMSRKGVPRTDEFVDEKLKARSALLIATSKGQLPTMEEKSKEKDIIKEEESSIGVLIIVQDEDDNELPLEFYGEPLPKEEVEGEEDEWDVMDPLSIATDEKTDAGAEEAFQEKQKILKYVEQCYQDRKGRLVDLEETFEEIKVLVERFQNANYDLGMVAGRQMSITSGEFIVNSIEKEIMEYINEQIAILPDPDLKKKKAKPDEIQMIRDILENYLDENIEKIIPDEEHVEEEEEPIPEIVQVYAVPGIGPPVHEDTIRDFEEYAQDVTKVQADLFMPRNIRHFMCPPLEKYQEHQYEEDDRKRKKNEEVTSGGGTIAD